MLYPLSYEGLGRSWYSSYPAPRRLDAVERI